MVSSCKQSTKSAGKLMEISLMIRSQHDSPTGRKTAAEERKLHPSSSILPKAIFGMHPFGPAKSGPPVGTLRSDDTLIGPVMILIQQPNSKITKTGPRNLYEEESHIFYSPAPALHLILFRAFFMSRKKVTLRFLCFLKRYKVMVGAQHGTRWSGPLSGRGPNNIPFLRDHVPGV